MLWRVRTTLADRPGALARMAQCCGDRGVNILGLQIFPDVGGVTDEVVLATPEGWDAEAVTTLVREAGGREVAVAPASDHALVDAPVRYLQAVRALHAAQVPASEVLAHLLDAEVATESDGAGTAAGDGLVLDVGGEQIVLRRATPFTPTEMARATAVAELADAMAGAAPESVRLPRGGSVEVRAAEVDDYVALQRMHARCSAESVYHRFGVPLLRLNDRLARRLVGVPGETMVAVPGRDPEEVVGMLQVTRRGGGTTPELAVLVEDAWQRRGVGVRLVRAAARLLAEEGYADVVLRGRADNQALLGLVTGLGLPVRLRMTGETVTALVSVGALRSVSQVEPVGAGGPPAA